MSFFEDASLVLIPSAQKTSKVYSVKPTDGSGDLTFSRSNDTASRVNSAGLIEKVRTNLVLQSQTIDNASWTKLSGSGGSTPIVTANYGLAPDGTMTAERVQLVRTTASFSYSEVKQDFGATGAQYTVSVYLKSLSGTPTIAIANDGASFNYLATLTSNWVRYTATFTATGTASAELLLYEQVAATSLSADFLVWGFQAETGDIATSYIATTSAAVSVGPVANVPRLDYLNSSCPRLLLEPQRTNSALFSEQFNNAAYSNLTVGSATAPIITANFAASPDGFQNADRLQFSRTGTTSSDLSLLQQSAIVLSATGTATIYLKSNTSSTQNVLLYWGGGQGIVFAVTPEWQRFTLPNLAAGTDTILIGTRGGSGSFYNGGDLTLDVLAYGLQIEAGAYATSYIPTLGAAVTRGADAASKTSASALIGQTEGTLFLEVNFKGGLSAQPIRHLMNVSDGTDNNRVVIYIQEGTTIITMYVQGGGTLSINDGAAYTGITTAKIALAYKSGSSAIYVNGSLAYSSSLSFAFNAALSQITVGSRHTFENEVGDGVSQALLFKTRLTNAQLAELTTL